VGFGQLEAAADLARARYEHDAALWETKALMAAETVAEEEAARLREEADTQVALEREARLHAEQHGRCVRQLDGPGCRGSRVRLVRIHVERFTGGCGQRGGGRTRGRRRRRRRPRC
jgi:hypothetical protein